MVRVFIVASTPAVQRGLRALIESGDIDIVGEGNQLQVALASDAEVVVSAVPPRDEDLTVLIRHAPALILLDDDASSLDRVSAFASDAWGVLPLSATGEELRAAIAAVASGLTVMPPSLARRRTAANPETTAPEGRLDEFLTDREREVLDLAAHGLANKQIASRLGISDHTVKFHLSTIYGKLGVASRTEAVSLALRRGLITL